MLKPTVVVRVVNQTLVAEFWDCLRLDPAPVSDLRRRVEDHIRAGGKPDLVVDLNGVEFAGSSALGGFLAIQRVGRQHDGRMVFCNVDPQVREVFRVSKLDSLFAFATDVPSALELLRTAGAARPDAPDGGSPESQPPETRPGGSASVATTSRPSTPPPLRLRRRPT